MIEISRTSLYVYRIAPDDPHVIQVKRNGSGGHRWKEHMRRPTPEAAKEVLWALVRAQEKEEEQHDS